MERALAYSKKNRLKDIIPKGYEGMSKVCRKVKDMKCYRQNLQLMIDAAFVENDSLYLAAGYSRLGSSLIEKPDRNFRQADSLLRRSLEISLIRKDTSGIAFAMANIGYNYYLERMYDSSLISYNKSLKYSIPAKLYSASANSLGNIGTIYRDLGNPEKSIIYYHKAIDQAKKENDWYNLQWVYKDMSEMYLRIRDTSNAFKSFVLFKKFSDSCIIKENTQGLTDAEVAL